jgi:cobalt-zinc-cadmium efflux system membrane fusion protein
MKSLSLFINDFFRIMIWFIQAVVGIFFKIISSLFGVIRSGIFIKKFRDAEVFLVNQIEENLPDIPKNFWKKHHRVVLRIIYMMIVVLTLLNFARYVYKPEVQSIGVIVDGDKIQFTGVNKPLNGMRSKPIEVGVQPVLVLPGRLVWDEEKTVKIFSPFAGRVQRVDVQLGQQVTKGQTLAIIQSPEFGMVQNDAKKSELMANLARLNLNRAKELFDQGIIAKKDLDQVSADSLQAFAEYDRALARMQSLGAINKSVDQRFQLTSTVKGTVVERNIYPGRELGIDLNAPPSFVVTDPSNLWAILELSEVDIGRFELGAEVTIFNNALPNEKLKGQISRIAEFIDPVTRTVKVRVTVPNDSLRLKAEMFIQAEIPLSHVDGLIVPSKAIVLIGDSHYVFVEIEPNQYIRKNVKLGTQFLEKTEVIEGLYASEKIVFDGALYLNEILRTQSKTSNNLPQHSLSKYFEKIKADIVLFLK